MSPARRFLRYLRPYRARYLAGLACLVLATGFSLTIPWTVKEAVDALTAGAGRDTVAAYAGLILVLALLHGVARLGSRFSMIGAGQWVEHDLRRDLYERFLRLPALFYHARRTGDLMSRATNDVTNVRSLAGFGSVMLAQTSLAFIGTLVAMSSIDPWLTLWALSPTPILVVAIKRFSHAVDEQSTAVQEQLGVLSAKVQENLTGMAVVRAYTLEPREIESFGRLNTEYLTRSVRLARTQAGFWPLMGLVGGLGALIILWLGGRGVIEGRISLGAFVAFNGYLAYLAWPTVALGWTLAVARRGLSSMERITEILDAEPDEVPVAPDVRSGGRAGAISGPPLMEERQSRGLAREEGMAGAISRPPLMEERQSKSLARSGALEFRSLTFAYPERGAALREVSVTVPEGALVAVVGPTGSGKSTLGALVCRLYDPPRGTVFVGGVDVLDLPLGALRRAIGYVPQDAFLFSRSLRDNARLADDHADDDRVRAAAATAGLTAEIEAFPEGWDTLVGERGLTLSGGQRQRVALARALLGDPPYLILDDVFAAVDPAKEAEILRSLRDVLRGRTTLAATHRLRIAETADWIVVLDEGRVVEQGIHANLIGAGGLYARLWRIQQIEAELEQA
jgi:ATP-binding cassette, subfamily B, multidrug efflux pump